MKRQEDLKKDLIDIILALIGLTISLPLLLILCFVVDLTVGRPPIFTQRRAGKRGRPFIIYKLKTMYDSRDVNGNLMPDERRVSTFGRILRFIRLDEIPELFNIVRGDMSFVGPRPTVLEQADKYDDFKKIRLSVRPGLTGWAQINGNTKLSWDDRIYLDVWYIDHRSLKIDLKIIVETFKVILSGEKVNLKALEEARKYAINTYRLC